MKKKQSPLYEKAGNDASNTSSGPVPHHKASDLVNREADAMRRDPRHLEKKQS